MKNFILLLISFFYFGNQSFAQTGKITGKVMSSKTGEMLIGATVSVDGTKKFVQSDQNGFFSISGLQPGAYKITCSYVSYTTKTTSPIKVVAGDVVNQDIIMDKKGDMSAVVIKGSGGLSRPKESVNSLLIAQKNSASVSDGISAEAIKRTPDKNTSDILKRVSGASIQDDKFVIVRGLNDRYNAAFLNGAPLPSTEADRKAFSFDIFPANMLDNLIINKTATPDMPAEFAGGSIFINTKDIVAKDFQSYTIGAGWNSITTFRDHRTYFGGRTDFLGYDDGTRALPKNIPSSFDFPKPAFQQPDLARNWRNEWGTHMNQAFLNLNMQYVNGRNFQRKEKDFFGSLIALTYSRNYNTTDGVNKKHVAHVDLSDTSGLESNLTQSIYNINVLLGGLANFSLKLNNNNSFSFKNILSINSEDKVIRTEGFNNLQEGNDAFYRKATTMWYTSSKMLSSQLLGDHYLPQSKIKINWLAGYSQIKRDVPDMRNMIYLSVPKSEDSLPRVPYAAIARGTTQVDNGGFIYYSTVKENATIFKIDAQRNFNLTKDITTNIKIGAYIQQRDRDYKQRYLGMVQESNLAVFNRNLLYLPEEKIFDKHNIGAGKFILNEDVSYFNNYTAKTKLNAAYLMLDQRFWGLVRLIYGYRIEQFNMTLNLPNGPGTEFVVDRKVTDLLPSANVVYSIDKKQNLRLCFSKTVNRPEFRELAFAKFYNFATRYNFSGDTALKRALIDNYDVRYEIYPGKGQMLTLSAFYKKFTDPIEQGTSAQSQGEAVTYNAISAENKGLEIEFRTLIGSYFKSSDKSILQNLTLFANASFIKSVVDARSAGVDNTQKRDRPLQGQSPYCFNAGLTYQNNDNGWSSTLSSNRVGQRILLVGNENEANVWENGKTMIDFQVAKTIEKKNLELKFTIKDLLAQKINFFEDTNQNNKYDKGVDFIRWNRSFGQSVAFNLTYKF